MKRRNTVNSQSCFDFSYGRKNAQTGAFVPGARTGTYYVSESLVTEEAIITMAQAISAKKLAPGAEITSPQATEKYLQNLLAEEEQELFGALFLNTRHRVIKFEIMFKGTIDGASVHPREVVKKGLLLNAAAVIFVHNHPSGDPEPSQADIQITGRLKSALALIDMRVLDHIIVGMEGVTSLAQRGHL
jgi:DNA repair protein RadC